MKEYLFIDGRREGYAPNQIDETMTVRELIEKLQEYDEDTPVMLINDRGYTYGSITESSFEIDFDEEEEEEDITYMVVFDIDGQNMNDTFLTKEQAVNYAKRNIDNLPTVLMYNDTTEEEEVLFYVDDLRG